ncbi:MAG: amino acid adenylation domain-containing protein [Verrucomicrobia bacterium]|nr:amino acid adenylation domain-containing protein [Verrucomicrobiota bacterium]
MPLWAPDLDGEFEIASWLSGILAAFLARLTGQFHLSISVTSRSLFPTDRQWSQLICPYIPVPWNIQASVPLQECWWDNRSLVHSLSSAGPFLLDLILRLDPDAPSAQSTSRFHSLCNAFIGTASDFSHLPSLPVLGIELSENYRFKFIASSYSLHTALAQALCHAFDNFFFSLSENPGLELPWLNLGNPGQVRRLNETFHFHADPDTVITSLIESVVDRYPDQLAVESSLGTLTYSELWQKAGCIGASLQSMGCQYGDHVGIYLDRSPDFVASLVGCLRAGACAVLLSTAQPPERLRQMATSASLLYLIADFSDPTLVPEWADGLKILQPAHASPNPISHIRKVSFDYSSHAYIIFTSGSTGNPKPVLVGHRELLHHTLAFQNALDLTPKDRVLQFAGLGFDVCLEEIFPTLAVGARIILRNDSLINTAKDFWEFVNLHSITLLNLPTAFWYSLVDESAIDMIPHSVRNLIVGGERVDAVYLERWFQLNPSRIRWWNGYGPTETTITATLISVDSPLDDTPPGNTVPIGFGLGCCDIFLLDAFGKPLPPGLPGEILVCGARVARGYFNQPDLTSQRFVEAPLVGRSVEHSRAYQTGDYGCILENGCLHFLGRNDSQVKIRGFRLELHDIEKNIEALEGVDQAIVLDFVRPGSSSSALAAFIKLSKNSNSSIKNIRLELAQRLPDYMIPASFSEIHHWPMTPNGKIHLKQLRNLALSAFASSDLSDSSPGSLPSQSSPLLNSITQAWKGVLNQAPHSLNQNFFESGGDSLAAMRLLSRISQSANQPVSLLDFYDVPTIQGLLNLLSLNPLSSASSPVHHPHRWFVSLSQSSNAIPVFIIPGGAGGDVETLIYKAITEKIGPGFTFLAFQPLQSGMDKFPFSSVSDLANACVAEMNAIHPHGPYFIIADCIGSILSFEIVASLEKSGKSIAMLALLDSQPGYHRDAASPPRHSKLKPLLDRFHRLLLHTSSLIRTHPFRWIDYIHAVRQKHHLHAKLLKNIQPDSHTSHHPQALGSAFFDLLVQHNPSKISSHIDDYLPTTKKISPSTKPGTSSQPVHTRLSSMKKPSNPTTSAAPWITYAIAKSWQPQSSLID